MITKKIIINLFLVGITYFFPWISLYNSQDDTIKMESIQVPLLLILFIGAGLLTYLNHKNQKQAISNKWLWISFEIIGIIGLLYSGVILWLLFVFRHGIGF